MSLSKLSSSRFDWQEPLARKLICLYGYGQRFTPGYVSALTLLTCICSAKGGTCLCADQYDRYRSTTPRMSEVAFVTKVGTGKSFSISARLFLSNPHSLLEIPAPRSSSFVCPIGIIELRLCFPTLLFVTRNGRGNISRARGDFASLLLCHQDSFTQAREDS
jgi:hypothetical protein